jgi:hypothetical protein
MCPIKAVDAVTMFLIPAIMCNNTITNPSQIIGQPMPHIMAGGQAYPFLIISKNLKTTYLLHPPL